MTRRRAKIIKAKIDKAKIDKAKIVKTKIDKTKIIQDPKLRGEWAESVFMERAGAQGLAVSKPWGDSKSFDFVVGPSGHFVSVQVKSTTVEVGGGYMCTVRKQGERYARGSFDFLAAYVIPENVWYIIPAEKFVGRATLILCSDSGEAKYEEYREAWGLLREASKAAIADAASEESDAAESDTVPPDGDGADSPVGGALGRLQAAGNFFKKSLERSGGSVGKRSDEV